MLVSSLDGYLPLTEALNSISVIGTNCTKYNNQFDEGPWVLKLNSNYMSALNMRYPLSLPVLHSLFSSRSPSSGWSDLCSSAAKTRWDLGRVLCVYWKSRIVLL